MKTEKQILTSINALKKQQSNSFLPKSAKEDLVKAVKILEWVLE